jgi:hypothetical protein
VLELVLDLRGRAVELYYQDGAGLGNPGWTAVSTASMHRESIISMAAGTIPPR